MSVRTTMRPLLQSSDQNPVLHEAISHSTDADTRVDGLICSAFARKGLTISRFDFKCSADILQKSQSFPCVSLNYVSSGSGFSRIISRVNRNYQNFNLRSGRFYFTISHVFLKGENEFRSGTRLRGIDVRMCLSFWDKIAGTIDSAVLTPDHIFHEASGDGYWIGVLPAPPNARRLAQEIQKHLDQGGDDLLVEAKALELVSIAQTQLREGNAGGALLARDARAAASARTLLLAELDRPWTLADLAAEIELPLRRLKTIFPAHTGMTMIEFLKERRLERAAQLLIGTQDSITEIALAVGYGSVSHFSALFRRRFGATPTTYRASHGA